MASGYIYLFVVLAVGLGLRLVRRSPWHEGGQLSELMALSSLRVLGDRVVRECRPRRVRVEAPRPPRHARGGLGPPCRGGWRRALGICGSGLAYWDSNRHTSGEVKGPDTAWRLGGGRCGVRAVRTPGPLIFGCPDPNAGQTRIRCRPRRPSQSGLRITRPAQQVRGASTRRCAWGALCTSGDALVSQTVRVIERAGNGE
jgi:hypothetical protein